MFNLCKHNDYLIDKKVLPSLLQQASLDGRNPMVGPFTNRSKITVLYTFKCKKCNRIRQTKMKS